MAKKKKIIKKNAWRAKHGDRSKAEVLDCIVATLTKVDYLEMSNSKIGDLYYFGSIDLF